MALIVGVVEHTQVDRMDRWIDAASWHMENAT